MQWQMFIKSLVNALDVDKSLANSYKDYHVKGMDYLNLHRTSELTVKYISCDGALEQLNKKYNLALNPHTKQYNQSIILLDGILDIVTFNYVERALPIDQPKAFSAATNGHNRFNYVSLLRNEISTFDYQDTGYLTIKEEVRLSEHGDNIHIKFDEIQSFRVIGDTKFLVLQYRTLKKPFTEFYQQNAVAPQLDDLYKKFTVNEITGKINLLDQFVSTPLKAA